ncbi:unnamed protein product [Somion occarium]|uniref:Calcium uniporter protein, mitochondrial n=1 Tax=Somion occarium TaxID=3059160 RepID=A0ABP1DTF9_9APHY
MFSAIQNLVVGRQLLSIVSQRTRAGRPCNSRPCINVFGNVHHTHVQWRKLSTAEAENINVSHSRFLSEASPGEKWKDGGEEGDGADIHAPGEDELVPNGKGKISPTSSHLFKLILPFHLAYTKEKASTDPPTVFLLHPSQPLSHVSRLILSSLPSTVLSTHPHATVAFQSTTPRGNRFQWSESTDVGDFIRDAARSSEFRIEVRLSQDQETFLKRDENSSSTTDSFVIPVTIPPFDSRTRFLRRRLTAIEQELGQMEELKKQCDKEAHRGARRMAVSGFGLLVVYWGTVARLTFWDYGWDVMEPITYLSGLSTVILGYLWFLYQGREVSYSSVLSSSISARRHALYTARGLDIERWRDLVEERRKLKTEIDRIRGEYDTDSHDEKQGEERERDEEHREVNKRDQERSDRHL